MKEIRGQIAALSDLQVKVGIVEGTGSVDGTDIAEYAAYNEYGVPGKKKKWDIPPRPFIRGWIENNQAEIKAMQDKLFGQVAEGKMKAETAIKKRSQSFVIRRALFSRYRPAVRRFRLSRHVFDGILPRMFVRVSGERTPQLGVRN